MLESLPEELKQYNHWCISVPGKKYPQLEQNGQLRHASVMRDSWLPFADAVLLAKKYCGYVGFVLTKDDPFVCIDIDVKDGESVHPDGEPYFPCEFTSELDLLRAEACLDAFDSYAEFSTSGKGLHIWVKGGLAAGRRRSSIEVYPHDRYIICTGKAISSLRYCVHNNIIYPDVLDNTPKTIHGRQSLLNRMIDDIKENTPQVSEDFELVEKEATRDDSTIFTIGAEASNGEKFKDLCNGNWQPYKYPSQSEADYALLSMLAYYTESNVQVRRMFRRTVLGMRDKATKNDVYIDRTLKYIRQGQIDQVQAEINLDEQIKQIKLEEMKKKVLDSPARIEPVDSEIGWPPGYAGDLARFVYYSSPRPVLEVSVVAALGLLAGICGKAYTVHHTGLNQYIVLIARSGTGKEAMHSGIDHVMDRLIQAVPRATNFVDKSAFVSGPALLKTCTVNQSFVNINGEWGRTFKRITDEKRYDPAMQQLRTVMTDLYHKSSPSSTVGGLKYSSKENDVGSVRGVAYSMIGETTPDAYYEAITESAMADGFLSRFTTIQYYGDRPPANENIILNMDEDLTRRLCELITYSLQMIDSRSNVTIGFDYEAQALDAAFDKECDYKINATKNEAFRQIWNRAHLKVRRMAGLLAAFNNHINPVITPVEYNWALSVVRHDSQTMIDKIKSGDVGVGDHSRNQKLVSLLHEYLDCQLKPGYKVPKEMQKDRIIPKRFLITRASRLRLFYEHKNGASFAVNETLKSLEDCGVVSEVPRDKIAKKFKAGFGKCYLILDTSMFREYV